MRIFVAVLAALTVSGSAAAQSPLKSAVILLGANATNDAIAVPAKLGELTQDLFFQIEKPLTDSAGKVLTDPVGQLIALPLQATAAPADIVAITLTVRGTEDAPSSGPLKIPLTVSTLQIVTIKGGRLRAGTTYKSALALAAAGQSHRWEITLTTAGRGILKAIPVGPLQFTALPPSDTMGQFTFTLRNRSFDIVPFTHVRASFEGPNTAGSKAIKPSLLGDAFSFYADGELTSELGLYKPDSDVKFERDQQIHVHVKRLPPGEYSGTLRFAADEAADDGEDSKLPLVIQVRHHWILPVLVLLLGSVVGWFSTKYVAAVRKAREMSRQVEELRARADRLARRDHEREGWVFTAEASSYALTKARVVLNQLARLVSSPAMMLMREDEIGKRKQDAETRISSIELFRATRLRVQPSADSKPAAQLAIGRLLRRATNLLEEPVLNEGRLIEFAALLKAADEWAAVDTGLALYRNALVARRRSDELPARALVEQLEPSAVRDRLIAMLDQCPQEAAFADAPMDALKQHDELMGKLVLLWNEHQEAWAIDLATAAAVAGQPLTALFDIVDRRFWAFLKTQTFSIERDTTSDVQVKTYSLVEVTLTSPAPHLTRRMFRHPLRVAWHVTPPTGSARTTETDGMTLVQYFNTPGIVRVSAVLRFGGEEIPIRESRVEPIALDPPLSVVQNPEYQTRKFFYGTLEWAVLAIAMVFAIATAMSAQYDSTFGSFGQYLALFIWAAGAASGGNMFKQLGTTSTPGGSADSALPAR